VFELYPLVEGSEHSRGARIGFSVEDVGTAFAEIVARGATAVRSPYESPWGRRAVVRDADGHAIELLAPGSVSTSAEFVSTSPSTV